MNVLYFKDVAFKMPKRLFCASQTVEKWLQTYFLKLLSLCCVRFETVFTVFFFLLLFHTRKIVSFSIG